MGSLILGGTAIAEKIVVILNVLCLCPNFIKLMVESVSLRKGGSYLPAPFLFLTILLAPFLHFSLLPSKFCCFPAPCSLMSFNLPAPFLIFPLLPIEKSILPAPWYPLRRLTCKAMVTNSMADPPPFLGGGLLTGLE